MVTRLLLLLALAAFALPPVANADGAAPSDAEDGDPFRRMNDPLKQMQKDLQEREQRWDSWLARNMSLLSPAVALFLAYLWKEWRWDSWLARNMSLLSPAVALFLNSGQSSIVTGEYGRRDVSAAESDRSRREKPRTRKQQKRATAQRKKAEAKRAKAAGATDPRRRPPA